MTTEIRVDLNKNAIEDLQELIQINFDSAKGCQLIADEIKSSVFSVAFLELAQERFRQAEELAMYVAYNHEKPERGGTYAGAFYRCWLRCKNALQAADLNSLLAEAEKGEVHIENAYKEAIDNSLQSAVNDILVDHFQQVKKSRKAICDLIASTDRDKI